MREKNISAKAVTDELKKLLIEIIESKSSDKASLVRKFENQVNGYWKENKDFFDSESADVFADLISDFAYYQPNPIIRLGDKSLFDNKKLITLIKDALKKLDE